LTLLFDFAEALFDAPAPTAGELRELGLLLLGPSALVAPLGTETMVSSRDRVVVEKRGAGEGVSLGGEAVDGVLRSTAAGRR
jgi:hypothetical protein